MTIKLFSRIFTLLLLAVTTSSHAIQILDQFPRCEYEVLAKENISINMRRNMTISDTTPRLLEVIQQRGEDLSADAIILHNRNKYIDVTKRSRPERLSFEAEFIKECQEQTDLPIKMTPYNAKGEKVIGQVVHAMGSRTIEFKLPQRPTLRHPEIHDNSITLQSGVYGVKLGDSYATVQERWGDPSIELQLYKDEFIAGFGRRHWLHFQNDQLKAITSMAPAISYETLNLIPLRDFFDDNKWSIGPELSYKADRTEVEGAISATPQGKKTLLTKSADAHLLYHFESRNGVQSLMDFTLRSADYTPSAQWVEINDKHQYEVLTQAFSQLQQGNVPGKDSLYAELGQPYGRILLSARKELRLVNAHISIIADYYNILKISAIESILSEDKSAQAEKWSFGDIKQGVSLAALLPSLPEDVFALDDNAEFETDLFEAELLFDVDGDNSALYQFEITLFQ